MDRYEREAKIAELRDRNEESRAEIERRKTEREENPAAFDVSSLADFRVTGDGLAYTDAISERREPAGGASVRKSDASGLLYRQHDDALQAHAPDSAPTPSNGDDNEWKGWNAWMRGHLDNEREVIAQAIGEVAAMLREEWRDEFKDAIAKRDATIARLEGQVEMLVRMLGSGKTADVIEVGKGIVRRVQNNE